MFVDFHSSPIYPEMIFYLYCLCSLHIFGLFFKSLCRYKFSGYTLVSKLLPDWIGEVKQSYEGDSLAEEVKKSISEARGGQDGWEEEEGVLRKKREALCGDRWKCKSQDSARTAWDSYRRPFRYTSFL